MADGTGAAIKVRVFDDPTLEAMRTAITEAEITQAVGRGRGVTRNGDNPLEVWLFGCSRMLQRLSPSLRSNDGRTYGRASWSEWLRGG